MVRSDVVVVKLRRMERKEVVVQRYCRFVLVGLNRYIIILNFSE